MNWLIILAGAFLLVGGTAGAAVVYNVEVTEWTRFDSSFQAIASSYGIDWKWLKAFALNESDLGRNSLVANGQTSTDGLSWGLMQVTLKTALGFDPAASIDKLANLNPADYSIDLASQLIVQNMNSFDNSDPRFTEYVVKAYNAGAGTVKKEINGTYTGPYAPDHEAYWERWQRNLQKVITG